MSGNWEAPNAEPTLDEILNDPIVRLLMRGDHTGEGEVRRLIEQARAAFGKPGDENGASSAPAARKSRRGRATRAA